MDVLYVMVAISLSLSLAFLALFFWAVDSEQMSSLDSASFLALDDDNNEENKGTSHE